MARHVQLPTVEELQACIDAAIGALVRDDAWEPVDHRRLLRHLDELGLTGTRATIVIRKSLKEIRPEHYSGDRPEPEKSYEKLCYGLPMYIFVWNSKWIGKRVYLKFCIAGDGRLILVNFHQDRATRGQE